MKSLTTSDVKQRNMKNVLHLIYKQKITTQQNITEILEISRPTLLQIIKDLEKTGLIAKDGFFESTGGRKANAITFVPCAKLAIGVELLADSFEISVIDLYGKITLHESLPLLFCNEEAYYHSVCRQILAFISNAKILPEQILGVAIVLQGLISSDSTEVTYGKILNCTGLRIEQFTKYLPYPCTLHHDGESAATAELWQNQDLKDAIFFHIRSNMSGAIIVNGAFLKGQELKSGVFEHMTIVPDGKPCYCGRNGCLDTYCSVNALLNGGETLHSFFQNLRNHDHSKEERWNNYLRYLAVAVNNLHTFIDYDIVLGGTIAPYLLETDVSLLLQAIKKITAFPSDRRFIKISSCLNSPISQGAALTYVRNYLDRVISHNI